MRRRTIFQIGVFLTLTFALIAVAVERGLTERPRTPVAESPPNRPLVESVLPLDPAYEEAALALRARECDTARDLLPEPSRAAREATGGSFTEAEPFRHLAQGLYAHACEDLTGAVRSLEAAADPGGRLEDWRLLVLAEAARAIGRPEAAREALATLLADYRESPLWERALLDAAEAALHPDGTAAIGRASRPEEALQLVRWSREQNDLEPVTIARLETLAWELGTARGNLTARVAAARRLLVHAPMTAANLEVAELFRRPDGTIPWSTILTAAELVDRAETLLRADLVTAALDTLAQVRPAERAFDWKVLSARALTAKGEADEALDLLDTASPVDEGEATRLAWERSRASASLASALRGGKALSATERARMAEAERQYLTTVVRLGSDRSLALAALDRLFSDYAEADDFNRATGALRLLRRFDPGDTTGVSYLWNLGWEAYQSRNYSGAIGYWTELVEIYPETRTARAGRYWTGRAFEVLGERDRARQVFAEVAEGPNDFYRKHARERLGGAVPADGGLDVPPPAPWPIDPALVRARLLSDLGLDEMAETEMAATLARRDTASDAGRRDASVDQRASEALRGLILARQGKRRASIPHLRRAFPALGGPHQASVTEEAQRLYYPVAFEEAVFESSRISNLPPHLVFGVIREESAFDITARSHVGATGLMQLMPATGKEVAGRLGLPFSRERLNDPAYNVRLGTTYLAQLMRMFDGTEELALAGYNGGPYRMKRLWREAQAGSGDAEMDYFLEALPVPESRDYVKRVMLFSGNYRDLYGL